MSANIEPLGMDVYGLARLHFPGQDAYSAAVKISNEAEELMDNPHAIAEAADVLITLMSWLVAARYSPQALIAAAEAKMRINHARTWAKQSNGTFQHVEGT